MRLYQDQPSGTVPQLRTLRRNATDAELALRRALRESLPTHKWRFQAPIGPFRVDFLRFWNNEVLESIEGVLTTIANSLSPREREGAPKARKGEGPHLPPKDASPSPSHAASRRGPLPLPKGEV